MVATRTVTVLPPQRVIALGHALFASQQSGEGWVCDASIDDLAVTILDRRQQLRQAIVDAPDASFEAQPNDERGEVVWSAGQCADHIVSAQYGVSETAILALAFPNSGVEFEQPAPMEEIAQPVILSREAALERLDRATPDFERLLDGVPADADLTPTLEHRYFGTINLAAILLITAWHEQNHTAQIQALG